MLLVSVLWCLISPPKCRTDVTNGIAQEDSVEKPFVNDRIVTREGERETKILLLLDVC